MKNIAEAARELLATTRSDKSLCLTTHRPSLRDKWWENPASFAPSACIGDNPPKMKRTMDLAMHMLPSSDVSSDAPITLEVKRRGVPYADPYVTVESLVLPPLASPSLASPSLASKAARNDRHRLGPESLARKSIMPNLTPLGAKSEYCRYSGASAEPEYWYEFVHGTGTTIFFVGTSGPISKNEPVAEEEMLRRTWFLPSKSVVSRGSPELSNLLDNYSLKINYFSMYLYGSYYTGGGKTFYITSMNNIHVTLPTGMLHSSAIQIKTKHCLICRSRW